MPANLNPSAKKSSGAPQEESQEYKKIAGLRSALTPDIFDAIVVLLSESDRAKLAEVSREAGQVVFNKRFVSSSCYARP